MLCLKSFGGQNSGFGLFWAVFRKKSIKFWSAFLNFGRFLFQKSTKNQVDFWSLFVGLFAALGGLGGQNLLGWRVYERFGWALGQASDPKIFGRWPKIFHFLIRKMGHFSAAGPVTVFGWERPNFCKNLHFCKNWIFVIFGGCFCPFLESRALKRAASDKFSPKGENCRLG